MLNIYLSLLNKWFFWSSYRYIAVILIIVPYTSRKGIVMWLVTYFQYSHYKYIVTQNARRKWVYAIKDSSREADAKPPMGVASLFCCLHCYCWPVLRSAAPTTKFAPRINTKGGSCTIRRCPFPVALESDTVKKFHSTFYAHHPSSTIFPRPHPHHRHWVRS